MAAMRETSQFNQSVARAVLILDAFAAAGGDMELGITELSETTGLAKSVVSRVVAPLVAGGYLEQNPRTRRYRVGLRMFELGLRYLRRPGAREAALMLLDDLVRETGPYGVFGRAGRRAVRGAGGGRGQRPAAGRRLGRRTGAGRT